MPKLDKKLAKEVDKVDAATGFQLLEEGRYAVRLLAVQERSGDNGPYWTWVLSQIHDEDGKKHPGRLFNNTSLSEQSHPFLKAVFEAFGYTVDSDTDEMVADGAWAVVYVIQDVQLKGKKAGQKVNQIQSWASFEPDEWSFDPDECEPIDDEVQKYRTQQAARARDSGAAGGGRGGRQRAAAVAGGDGDDF